MFCKKYNQQSYGHDTWNKTACSRLRLQSITSHENSTAHRTSVRLELSGQRSQNISHIINPPVPKRGIKPAFASLYFQHILFYFIQFSFAGLQIIRYISLAGMLRDPTILITKIF